MLCRDLGWALFHHGIRASVGWNGDDQEDGQLMIGPNVCVQVPTFGGPPRVLVESSRFDLLCYPPRESVEEIAEDIRHALNEQPCAFASSSVH
jgi:hypothetical protein